MAPSLNKVRDIYRGVVAYQLLRSFKVDGYLRGSRGTNFEEFIRGIYGERRQLNQLTTSSLLPDDEEDWTDVQADGTAPRNSKQSPETRQSYLKVKKAKITVEIPSKTSKSFLLSKSTLSPDSTRAQERKDSQQVNRTADTGTQYGHTAARAEKVEQVDRKPDVAKQPSPAPEMNLFIEELLQHAAIPSPSPLPPPLPVVEKPKRHRSKVFTSSPADAVATKVKSISAIDLTVEDDHSSGTHNAAPRQRKVRAPENSPELFQARPTANRRRKHRQRLLVAKASKRAFKIISGRPPKPTDALAKYLLAGRETTKKTAKKKRTTTLVMETMTCKS
ncbi:hypothetical protein G647_01616 [Cladophialophora carrionii CBS 160.54]|uniref:Uncharacterized protein n=1 Tax=Cladophialophora carrionii CBS 160.54 TaxID=1279043 RepID=V9DS66_9EURO|nr:uncharacterized protein G647_01616 [Cladophialophora carrionii CBS 160.54]ETI29163.1 hypothetical protein G647_01616 [Cladophialophora carrionii CBS 160.54]